MPLFKGLQNPFPMKLFLGKNFILISQIFFSEFFMLPRSASKDRPYRGYQLFFVESVNFFRVKKYALNVN